MKNKLKQKEFKIWGLLAIVITIVWLIVVWMLFDGQKNNEEVF